MPMFVIEREIAGVGNSTPEALKNGAKESNAVIRELGPAIQWVHSYITADKIYCVYIAEDENIIVEHARCAGIPADRISRVAVINDPTTAE